MNNINNMNVVANVEIISELKRFLEEISSSAYRMQQYKFSAKDFTRKRILTFTLLSMLILNALKRSLSVELQDFFANFTQGKECTKQAFCEHRVKLKPEFFHEWNDVLAKNFYHYYGDRVKKWKEMLLWAMDGSTVALPDTEELRKHYGFASNQKGDSYPVARTCVLYDVLNQIAIKGFMHPYNVSEEQVSLDCLKNENMEEVLLLFDRGYPSYWLIYNLMKKKTHFVMRAQRNYKVIDDFLKSDQTDICVDLCPSNRSLKKLKAMGYKIDAKTPIKVRLVKIVLDTGEIEILITNLYDKELFSIDDLKEVYSLRWGIETFYGCIKEELQLQQFSGIRKICIEQDFAANLFLFNLQCLIEKQSDDYLKTVNEKRKHNYKVNKNVSWASLKYRVVKLFIEKDTIAILSELQYLFQKHLEPVRPNRKYPRKKKQRPDSKFYTLTNYKRAL